MLYQIPDASIWHYVTVLKRVIALSLFIHTVENADRPSGDSLCRIQDCEQVKLLPKEQPFSLKWHYYFKLPYDKFVCLYVMIRSTNRDQNMSCLQIYWGTRWRSG
jgi:hypothetical protein